MMHLAKETCIHWVNLRRQDGVVMAEWTKGRVIGFANPLPDPLGVECFLAMEATAFSASSQKLTARRFYPYFCTDF